MSLVWNAAAPYNGRMDRLVDKLIVSGCSAALAVSFFTGAVSVALPLAASALSLLLELPAVRARLAARIAVPAAACACALVAPAGISCLPVAAYDLVGLGRAVPLASSAVWLVAVLRGGVGLPAGALSAGMAILACALALRTAGAREQSARGHRMRDELRERSIALEAANRDLLDRRSYELRVAVLEERARIAREIHDDVGHLLTRLVMQAEAYRVVFASNEAARDAFATLGETLRRALDRVRASVHDLRDESVDLSVQVASVVAESPVPVKSSVSVESAPPEVAACLLAVIREALSNAARHGDATAVELELVEHPGLWQLSLRDNGTVPPALGPTGKPDPRGGMGLQSMEERVRALNGTFQAGWGPGAGHAETAGRRAGGSRGFYVFASIPKGSGATARGPAAAASTTRREHETGRRSAS